LQQCEATYQRCLKIDLKEAALAVELEKISSSYKGNVVGTRRADLLVTTKKKEVAVIEVKAVHNISPNHVGQLQYYMDHFNIHQGYIVNFPHNEGFLESTRIPSLN
jgi:GxxExxY protein